MSQRQEKKMKKVILWCAVLCGCGSSREFPPAATPSSERPADVVVRGGLSRPLTPACVIVPVGATVEWRNWTPDFALTPVSARPPYEISAPALREPYNFVERERSEDCEERDAAGACIERAEYSYWRHTFLSAGVFDYRDLPVGEAALEKQLVQTTGTVCVQGSGSDCVQVCCDPASASMTQCAAGVQCLAGRCGGVRIEDPGQSGGDDPT